MPQFPSTIDLSALDGTTGFRLVGTSTASKGVSAGDFNGDGYADIIVGSPTSAPSNTGAGYVFFGAASGFASIINLSSLDGSNGFKLSGAATFNGAGRSVDSAGDFNGDGFDDVIIGANGADLNGITDTGAS